jgi:UDP-N-acetylmuramoyl-tripeptide--D-alanyl-D-alanine ligase
MKPVMLSQIAQWTGGELAVGDVAVETVSNDSRTLVPGCLYVALRGERFDGHDFAASAAARGASGLLIERDLLDLDLPQVKVSDTRLALRDIATQIQRTRSGKVIALTGSNGKTSVKALILSILKQAGTAYANPGNHNNEIGLPLAIINAPDDAEFFIYEMGAGKPGDIAYLTAMATSSVALVNNVAVAHLERLGSLLGVAETKGAIYTALPAGGVAVINADETFAPWFEQHLIRVEATDRRILRFGLEHSADVTARAIRFDADGSQFVLVTPQGEADVRLPLQGRHNVSNALAAATLALACAVPLATIVAGLAAVQPVAGRQTVHRLRNGALLIDDSYNANPSSLAAAIATLADDQGERWLVLGDMLELGDCAEALHAAVAAQARTAGISRLYALGMLSATTVTAFGDGGRHFQTHAALTEALHTDLNVAAAASRARALRILVKGSRGSAMEQIIVALQMMQGGQHDAV